MSRRARKREDAMESKRYQPELGQLWDEMLHKTYGGSHEHGSMDVTATEAAAFKRGWDACMEAWASHMQRMARAVAKSKPANT